MSSFNTMNKAMLIGRLGQDPELKHTTGGTAVCNFSVATDSSYKQNDSWEEKTEWHRVVVFSSLAETVAKYLSKGSTCFVEGRLQTRKYQDRDGNTKSLDAEGLLAIAIQHEMDHLEGILFIDKLSYSRRKKFEKEYKKFQRERKQKAKTKK